MNTEWLEADGLGGFASGTVSGVRTRRYHALLLAAVVPPTGRFVLVDGFEAWVTTGGGPTFLTTQRYGPDISHPDGAQRIVSFSPDPWPTWTYRLDDGTEIEQELLVPHDTSVVAMRWRLRARRSDGPRSNGPRSHGPRPDGLVLTVRPFLSGRESHSLHHENPAFRFDAQHEGERVRWHPYPGLPAVVSLSNGVYQHEPFWYRNFLLDEELARGLDCLQDLAAPGTIRWDLTREDAVWILAADGLAGSDVVQRGSVAQVFARLRDAEAARRHRFPSRLHRSADAYLVKRGAGKTIVAGYPWFTDWGRDTFIALRGLCLATGRLDDAAAILLEWAGAVSRGMLPNRFVEQGDTPEFNSVDASLWYVIAAHDYLRAAAQAHRRIATADRVALEAAVEAILVGYAEGTRHGIGADTDGLLLAGEPGMQLTWMDAKIGEWVVTPRIGKPVEIQALWLNALRIGAEGSGRWSALYERARAAFETRFWNEDGGYLYDVVDVDRRAGTADPSFRPNQILAVGGLPYSVLEGARARQVVDAVEARLWTPLGLRSLAPDEPGYVMRYGGGVRERDGGYHQGTVWPWLAGPFVEAWVRVRGDTAAARREARRRFVEPLLAHLDDAGLGHVSEVADADAPHTPNGCPFQAWSVGELLRLDQLVLAPRRKAMARTMAAAV